MPKPLRLLLTLVAVIVLLAVGASVWLAFQPWDIFIHW